MEDKEDYRLVWEGGRALCAESLLLLEKFLSVHNPCTFGVRNEHPLCSVPLCSGIVCTACHLLPWRVFSLIISA